MQNNPKDDLNMSKTNQARVHPTQLNSHPYIQLNTHTSFKS